MALLYIVNLFTYSLLICVLLKNEIKLNWIEEKKIELKIEEEKKSPIQRKSGFPSQAALREYI